MLRLAGSLSCPRQPPDLIRGLRSSQSPGQTARQLPDPSTLIRVEFFLHERNAPTGRTQGTRLEETGKRRRANSELCRRNRGRRHRFAPGPRGGLPVAGSSGPPRTPSDGARPAGVGRRGATPPAHRPTRLAGNGTLVKAILSLTVSRKATRAGASANARRRRRRSRPAYDRGPARLREPQTDNLIGIRREFRGQHPIRDRRLRALPRRHAHRAFSLLTASRSGLVMTWWSASVALSKP